MDKVTEGVRLNHIQLSGIKQVAQKYSCSKGGRFIITRFPGEVRGTVISVPAANAFSRTHTELERKGGGGEDRDSWIGRWRPVRVDAEDFAGGDGF